MKKKFGIAISERKKKFIARSKLCASHSVLDTTFRLTKFQTCFTPDG